MVGANASSRDVASIAMEDEIDGVSEEILVDAYRDDDQLSGFEQPSRRQRAIPSPPGWWVGPSRRPGVVYEGDEGE